MTMRKIAITIILSLAAVVSYAQTAYDALMFSENYYEGTARTVAMGNAFTALGGDLGAITINPAAGAISGYSQYTITPALTFSTNKVQGVSPYADGSLPYFQREMKSTDAGFAIPNMGLNFSWETGRKRGLKSMNFGFVVNQTNTWNENIYANGTNSTTSFMGALATEATLNGYDAADLDATNAYEYMPWSLVSAYQSGMISTYGGYSNNYIGASQDFYYNSAQREYVKEVKGQLEQTYGHQIEGTKQEYIFNWGGNISDFIYIGANLGFSSITYAYDTYFTEKAVNPDEFDLEFDNGEIIYFHQMKYSHTYRADGLGVFGKLGVIVTPGYGLRFGAAIQTPTATTMTESWTDDGDTKFSTGSFSALSPYIEAEYTFFSPMRANFGAAYTLGQLGLISVDYEVADYSKMKYDTNNSDRQYFEEVNSDIRKRFGKSNMLRIGLEVKPLPELAIRAGYGYTTSAEKLDEMGYQLEPITTQTASFGLGYSSKDSFFADFALKTNILPDEYILPYVDYEKDTKGKFRYQSPIIRNRRSLWKAFITFGWRF